MGGAVAAVAAALPDGRELVVWPDVVAAADADSGRPAEGGALPAGATALAATLGGAGLAVLVGTRAGDLLRLNVDLSAAGSLAAAWRKVPRSRPVYDPEPTGTGGGSGFITPLKRLSSMVVGSLGPAGLGGGAAGAPAGVAALTWAAAADAAEASRPLLALNGPALELWRVDLTAGGPGGAPAELPDPRLVWAHALDPAAVGAAALQPLAAAVPPDANVGGGAASPDPSGNPSPIAVLCTSQEEAPPGAHARQAACVAHLFVVQPAPEGLGRGAPQTVRAHRLAALPTSAAGGPGLGRPGDFALRSAAGLRAALILSRNGEAWGYVLPIAEPPAGPQPPLLVSGEALDACAASPATDAADGRDGPDGLFAVLTAGPASGEPAVASVAALLVAQSAQMLDALPKHMAGLDAGEAGAALTAAIDGQLAEKARRHAAFLELLGTGRWLGLLGPADRARLFEGGEQVRALQALRARHNDLQAAASASASAAAALDVLRAVVDGAGARIQHREPLLAERPRWEVAYSRVSAAAAVFEALEEVLQRALPADSSLAGAEAGARLQALVGVALSALDAADGARAQTAGWSGPGAGYPTAPSSWLSAGPVRGALAALCRACVQVRGAAAASNPGLARELAAQLHALSGRLLGAQRAALEAAWVEGGAGGGGESEAWRALREDYAATKLEVLGALMAIAREEEGPGPGGRPGPDLREATAALAEVHRSYGTLFQLCWDAMQARAAAPPMDPSEPDEGAERLHHYMALLTADAGTARVGDREGFAAFVFQQLHRRRALKRLMTLPPEFDERLLAYLRGAPDTSEQGSQLLFLQLWKLGRWQEAAAHLQRLAGAAASVGAKRRLLAYAKASLISVRSYEGTKERYVEASAAVAAVDRQLGALALQSGLVDDDDDKAAPLAVGALAERLLGARKVDEVFQLLTLFPELQAAHPAIVAAAWGAALAETDARGANVWEDIHARRRGGGLADAEYRRALEASAVFRAAALLAPAPGDGGGADTAMAEPWRRQGGGISEGAAQAAGDAWRLGAQRRRAAAREAGERFPFAGVLAARPTA